MIQSLKSSAGPAVRILQSSILPVLTALYPLVFHYGNNVRLVPLAVFLRLIPLYLGAALVVFAGFALFARGDFRRPAVGASVFLVFCAVYGYAYDWLREIDLFRVEHYTFLPLYALTGGYAASLAAAAGRARTPVLWNAGVVVFGGLLLFNLVQIVPVEFQKVRPAPAAAPASQGQASEPGAAPARPDIYFIILDEYAGFQAVRDYWQDDGIDEFAEFLKQKGFFVAEDSHVAKADTVYALASRLNYEEYPLEEDVLFYFEAIASSRVMRDLEQRGYTTVVYDQTRTAYPTKPSITADFVFESAPSGFETRTPSAGLMSDEFSILVLRNTIGRPWVNEYALRHQAFQQHQDMIFYSFDRAAQAAEFPAPRFVYIHLLIPHVPFLFNEDGGLIYEKYYYNWNYYHGYHRFATRLTRDMVDGILKAYAGAAVQPVIILQSDHGARSGDSGSPDAVLLENYPEEYKTLIMNAMYLPGCDTSGLPQDINPVSTFPVVFNCYFETDLPVR